MLNYQYNCIYPENEEELAFIIDNMTPVSLSEFTNHVDKDDFLILQNNLGYGPHLSIINDYHVHYYKCYLPKEKFISYILVHSAIEYIFY